MTSTAVQPAADAPGRRPGRPEAAAEIWRWRAPAAGVEAPSAARARRRGLLQALGAGVFGTLLFVFWSQTIATIVFCVAGIIGLSALLSPTGLYAGVEKLFVSLAHWTGRGLTWLLMVPLFYLFFLPFGLLFRRGRRDRMRRFYEPEAPSYWEPREGRVGSQEKQY